MAIWAESAPRKTDAQVMALIGIGKAILELKDALSGDAPVARPWVQALLPGLDEGPVCLDEGPA
jgi:hypothetical protein